MRQFHDTTIEVEKAIIESGGTKIDMGRGNTLELLVVDKLPERCNGIRIDGDHGVTITQSDLAELEKTNWLNNTFGNQKQSVHLLPPRTETPLPTKGKSSKNK